MRDHFERQLDPIRARVRRLADEEALHRAMGREALADRVENELGKAEIEAGYLENILGAPHDRGHRMFKRTRLTDQVGG